MSQILKKVRELDPHDVDAAKEALSTFFPNLTKHKDGDCIIWLRALESVVNRFPKQCGSQRATIEKYVAYFLDTTSYNSVIEAAKCAHVLQQVRPGQEKAATPKVCWRDLMNALCNAVHSLISEIFPNAANIYRNGDDEIQTSSESILLSTFNEIAVVSGHDKILNRESILSTRLRNVFIFIQAMLVEIYPVAKPVRPQVILDSIIRALSASADGSLAELVGTVKQEALRTLDALVACLGSNLIPFSPLVFKCVMQTLRWSSENEDSSAVRILAYNSLGAWLTCLRRHRAPQRARGWHDELQASVARDVTPARHAVQLTMNNPPRNLSKKQKKKHARIMLQQSSISAYSPSEINKKTTSAESNDQLVIAALECTEIFLTVCGMFLKPAAHKVFHELLVSECFHLSDYSSERGLALLRALEGSRRTAPPGVPPPTQYCLQLYSVLINSQHREISKFCSQALLDIRMHLHCSPPSLNFAAEPQTETKKVVEDKKISRRNREALESLLGADKVPPKTSEIVIEVPPEQEEPAIKKPRIEDVSDQISLSSTSEDSIEICESDSEEVEEIPIDTAEITRANNILEVTAEVHEISHDIEDSVDKANTIHEATTQMPLYISNDTVDGNDTPKSMEVEYGSPNTGTERVPVLEKLEDENLPSTNDTDDVQITCGQVVRATPEDDKKENDCEEVKIVENEHKVNGVKSPIETPNENAVEGSVTVKIAANNDGVSVEDMLADFVDEVNDDNVTQA